MFMNFFLRHIVQHMTPTNSGRIIIQKMNLFFSAHKVFALATRYVLLKCNNFILILNYILILTALCLEKLALAFQNIWILLSTNANKFCENFSFPLLSIFAFFEIS